MWTRIRAVIIEDEPLAAQYLATLLDETCQVEVVGSAFRLEVRSEVGQGTTVVVRMPLRTQGAVGEEARAALTVSRAPLASG